MAGRHAINKDLYKVLKVSRGATTTEIKSAYRKMALALHPDRHGGDQEKTMLFKEVSEAYNILTDANLRREYDLSFGISPSGWYNKNRRRPPPANYRKVYAPHAPPEGKWHDAQRHYDMHYGEGQFREAVKNAYERAKAAGEFEYKSPLGKGFSFDTRETRTNGYGQNSYLKNPYSKAEQGPPEQQYRYEESSMGESKAVLQRRENVVTKLHERRQERYEKEAMEAVTSVYPGQRVYQPLNAQSGGACQIM